MSKAGVARVLRELDRYCGMEDGSREQDELFKRLTEPGAVGPYGDMVAALCSVLNPVDTDSCRNFHDIRARKVSDLALLRARMRDVKGLVSPEKTLKARESYLQGLSCKVCG